VLALDDFFFWHEGVPHAGGSSPIGHEFPMGTFFLLLIG